MEDHQQTGRRMRKDMAAIWGPTWSRILISPQPSRGCRTTMKRKFRGAWCESNSAMKWPSSDRFRRVVLTPPILWFSPAIAPHSKGVCVVTTWDPMEGGSRVIRGWCSRRGRQPPQTISPPTYVIREAGIRAPRCHPIPDMTMLPSVLWPTTFVHSRREMPPRKNTNHDGAHIQAIAGFRSSFVLFVRGAQQYDRLQLQFPVYSARPDDGLHFPGQPRHVARHELAGVAHGILLFDHCVGVDNHGDGMVGRDTAGAGVASTRSRIQSCQETSDCSPHPQPPDVARGLPQCWRRVVPDVAIKSVERPGRCLPHVHRNRPGVVAGGKAGCRRSALASDCARNPN